MPAPSVHLKIKIAVAVRRGISKRSHEKIGDCEQSKCRTKHRINEWLISLRDQPLKTLMMTHKIIEQRFTFYIGTISEQRTAFDSS